MYVTSYVTSGHIGFGQYKAPTKDHKHYTLKVDEVDYSKLPSACSSELASDYLAGVTADTIEALLSSKASYYHEFDIPKKNGKMRHIKEPIGKMKQVQKTVIFKMKSELGIMPHDAAHGFVKYRNCLSAMKRHQVAGSIWFAKFDLSDFFPSISKEIIINELGKIANLQRQNLEFIADILTDETGHLTQGCVSSPYIANLVLTEFDYKLTEWCVKQGLTYTRYADDLCISADHWFPILTVQKEILELLPNGIKLNKSKTKLSNIYKENIFLGIHYNMDKDLTVGYKTKKLMKTIAHKAKYCQLPPDEFPTWKGRLSYYKSIEPEYFKQVKFVPLEMSAETYRMRYCLVNAVNSEN